MNRICTLFLTSLSTFLPSFLYSQPLPTEEELLEKYPNRMLFGMNPSGIADWSTQYPFADLLKQSRPWQTAPGKFVPTANKNGNLTKLPEGTPSAYATTVLGTHHPKGIYTLKWEGDGEVSVPRNDVVEVVENGGNYQLLKVKPEKSLYVEISRTNPDDPVRNIQLFLPGLSENEHPFNPEFLEFMQPFGVIRFMDWMHTNNSHQQEWSNRPRPGMQTFRLKASTGVPVEWMVELSNLNHSDPWFCMPHLATDQYVREFAKIVKEQLHPERKVYVEYSNEVWNWNFQQSKYALEKGKAELGVVQGKGPHRAWVAHRSIEMFKIWEEVFEGTDRLVRVLPAQHANPRIARQTLDYENAEEYFDAIALAPYFGFNKELAGRMEEEETDMKNVLDTASMVIETKVVEKLLEHQAIAEPLGMDIIAYEAGQHLLDRTGRRSKGTTNLAELYMEANRHPRMAELYEKYYRVWFENGGGVLGLFAGPGGYSKFGSWGIKEYLSQPIEDAPKYRATIEAVKNPDLIPD